MDDSKAESLRSLASGTTRHWRALVTGTVISLLSWGVWQFGIQPLSAGYLVAGLAITVMISMFLTFHEVRVKGDALAKRLQPALELTVNGPSCYQAAPGYQLRRVIVTNTGGATVSDVKVELNNLQPDPLGLSPKMPLLLRWQHKKDDLSAESRFSLNPGEGKPIDVFSLGSIPPQEKPNTFKLWHAVEWVDSFIPAQTYRAELLLTGRDTPAVTFHVTLAAEHDKPVIRLLD